MKLQGVYQEPVLDLEMLGIENGTFGMAPNVPESPIKIKVCLALPAKISMNHAALLNSPVSFPALHLQVGPLLHIDPDGVE